MPPSIELRARQSLALTPRLQQSVRLLQLSSLEFQQELRTALDTNPFLEYDASQTEDVALATDSAPATTEAAGGADLPATSADAPAETPAQDSAESSLQDDAGGDYGDAYERGASRHGGDSEGGDPADWARVQPSLHEQLHDALRLYPLGERDREVARLIIE
ncbi:MAG TPA: RNA polymerase factor sigma-54, partial [Paraburkholderia sp.]|nr:RNA polymerase factor sigma-54 [Paraburkholderia sp.]